MWRDKVARNWKEIVEREVEREIEIESIVENWKGNVERENRVKGGEREIGEKVKRNNNDKLERQSKCEELDWESKEIKLRWSGERKWDKKVKILRKMERESKLRIWDGK